MRERCTFDTRRSQSSAEANTQHAHSRLGCLTPGQYRWKLRLHKLPASFVVPTDRQPLAAGRVNFIRRVGPAGTASVLSQAFRVRKRHRGLDLRLVVGERCAWLTAYLNGRVLTYNTLTS